jgi:NADPH2:quinone reductase
MKALLCTAFGPIDNLKVEDVAAPTPANNQVVVAVKAASVNFPDGLIVQGLYQEKPALPFSPGMELSGTIAELGADVAGWKIGDRVMATVNHGAFAERCAVDVQRLVALPSGMDYTEGSAFLVTYGTALHALKDRAQTTAEDTVLILGAAGGVGIAAIQVAKQLGARVIAAASSDEKTALCRASGADEVINYTNESLRDRIKALTGNEGVSVVVDSIGGEHSETAMRNLGWRGRFLVVGFAAGTIPRIPLNLALLKEREILGVFWGDAVKRDPAAHQKNMQLLQAWLSEQRITPAISEEVSLHEAAAAIERIANRQLKGKVVVRIADE